MHEEKIENVMIGSATITPEIGHHLGCMQANNNEDIHMMIGQIAEMKRHFISTEGSGDPREILGYLGYLQYIEDYIRELIFEPNPINNGK